MIRFAAVALLLIAQDKPKWKHGLPPDPKFFPIAVWLQAPKNAPAFKEAGINVFVGLWKGPTEEQLDALKAAGMKVVCEQNEVALARKDDDTIVAWMHGDEPDNAQSKAGGGYGPPILPEVIQERYKKWRAADPSRPILLNMGQGVAYDTYIGRGVRRNHPEDYAEYVKGCDIASFDIYPVVHDEKEVSGKLWYVPQGVDRLVKAGGGEKIVWNCIECSRIGNPDVKPTARQIRTEVWMSIVHGSTGIIYFVHQFKPRFVEASLLDDADLLKGVTEINRQIQALAPALNSPTVKDGASANKEAAVDVLVKRHDGATYVFAVSMRDGEAKAAIAVRGMKDASVEVIGEGRTLKLRGGKLDDDFKGYDAHLYRIQ